MGYTNHGQQRLTDGCGPPRAPFFLDFRTISQVKGNRAKNFPLFLQWLFLLFSKYFGYFAKTRAQSFCFLTVEIARAQGRLPQFFGISGSERLSGIIRGSNPVRLATRVRAKKSQRAKEVEEAETNIFKTIEKYF